MDHYKETINTWNQLAQAYEEKFMDLDLYNDTYAVFCGLLKQQAKVLELGCGPGNITRYLLHARPDLQLLASDVAPAMVELAAKNNPATETMKLDSRDMSPLKDRKFDAIVAGFCIPYLSAADVNTLIKQCRERLLKQGSLYLSFVEGDPANSGFITGSTGLRTYFYYHPLTDITGFLEKHGFVMCNCSHKNYRKSDGTGEVHTVLIATLN